MVRKSKSNYAKDGTFYFLVVELLSRIVAAEECDATTAESSIAAR